MLIETRQLKPSPLWHLHCHAERRVLTVGGSFAALCVTPDMNMFPDRGFAIVIFFVPAEEHGSELRVARRSSHLGRWLEGLWACPCTSQPKKAIRLKRQGTGSCSHGSRLNFDGPHQRFVVHISVPFPPVGRGARTRILVMAKEVAVRSREDLDVFSVCASALLCSTRATRGYIFLQLMSTMNGTSTSVLLVLLFIAKNIGTPVQMAQMFAELSVMCSEVELGTRRMFTFADITVVPGLGISQSFVNVDQNLRYVSSSISVVGLRIPI